jgi:hypothetical protein
MLGVPELPQTVVADPTFPTLFRAGGHGVPPPLRDGVTSLPGKDRPIGKVEVRGQMRDGDSIDHVSEARYGGSRPAFGWHTVVHPGNVCDEHNPGQAGKRIGSPGLRLRHARIAAGFETAIDFVKHINVNYTTYAHHENGRRSINVRSANLYAEHLRVSPSLILYGEELPSNRDAPIVGIVGNGGILHMTENSGRTTVPLCTTAPLVVLLVAGNDLYPAYRDGDQIFIRPLVTEGFTVQRVHGLECVVQLDTGELLLRQVTVQPDGRATLIAYAAPPRFDALVVAASPVEIVRRSTLS